MSNYLLCFFFYKIGEQEGETGSANNVYNVSKCKKLYLLKLPGIRRGRMKESSGVGEFKYNVLDTL
jgi:hypothetical protein